MLVKRRTIRGLNEIIINLINRFDLTAIILIKPNTFSLINIIKFNIKIRVTKKHTRKATIINIIKHNKNNTLKPRKQAL